MHDEDVMISSRSRHVTIANIPGVAARVQRCIRRTHFPPVSFAEMVPRIMSPASALSARVPSHTDPSLQTLAWEARHLSGPHGPGAVSSSLAFHASSNGIERVYAEPAGIWWKVTEHLQDGCWSLVFMSAAAIRRVRAYPPDWWQLSNGDLAALSWAR
jgi:hypothetical protein